MNFEQYKQIVSQYKTEKIEGCISLESFDFDDIFIMNYIDEVYVYIRKDKTIYHFQDYEPYFLGKSYAFISNDITHLTLHDVEIDALLKLNILTKDEIKSLLSERKKACEEMISNNMFTNINHISEIKYIHDMYLATIEYHDMDIVSYFRSKGVRIDSRIIVDVKDEDVLDFLINEYKRINES